MKRFLIGALIGLAVGYVIMRRSRRRADALSEELEDPSNAAQRL